MAGSGGHLWDSGDRRPAEKSIQAPLAGSPQCAAAAPKPCTRCWTGASISCPMRDRRVLATTSDICRPVHARGSPGCGGPKIKSMRWRPAEPIASLINKSRHLGRTDPTEPHTIGCSTQRWRSPPKSLRKPLTRTPSRNNMPSNYAQYLASRAGKGLGRVQVRTVPGE